MKGNKIRLVNPIIGAFTNVGEVCEVIDIAEGGVIRFRFGDIHLGCMSYDEFQKYFELVEEKPKLVEEKPKREWSNWRRCLIDCFDFSYEDPVTVEVEYRHNGKTVQIRSKDGIKSEATCNKCDIFNFDKGFSLARKRFVIKYLENQLKGYIRTL